MAGVRKFIGPLSKRDQLLIDRRAANKELEAFIPEKCFNCWTHLRVAVLGRLATQIANNEITIAQGTQEVVDYTASCTGSEVNAARHDGSIICPKEIAEEGTEIGTVQ